MMPGNWGSVGFSKPLATGLALAMAFVLTVGSLVGRQEEPFPHGDHEGLFPLCIGCHVGIPDGNANAFYPDASQCAGCHDGQDEELVAWVEPTPRTTNVVFDHVEHEQELVEAGDPVVTCESCHSDPAGGRMSVDSVEEVGQCWSCHAHERDDHYEGSQEGGCEACHVPLSESEFQRERLEALPEPADHDVSDFLLNGHGLDVTRESSRCATCHTADRCVACHVDADREEILEIPAAPADMDQPVWSAEYPEPVSHETNSWLATHYPGDEGKAECVTCHTTDDCRSCHIGNVPEVVASLPARAEVQAPGVMLEAHAPETHESLFFMGAHSNLAASAPANCATCHTQTYCVDCHDGPSDGGYHPPNFVAQHPAAAFGRGEDCSTCHSTAAFCRQCHVENGLDGQGRLGAGYHDAEPLFLLRHGQAARQSLESCASCHEQTDCVQCHGVLGAYQVSPHGPDFDAQDAWARSPRTCLACHVSNPLGGGL